jgi:hypothetical protein
MGAEGPGKSRLRTPYVITSLDINNEPRYRVRSVFIPTFPWLANNTTIVNAASDKTPIFKVKLSSMEQVVQRVSFLV